MTEEHPGSRFARRAVEASNLATDEWYASLPERMGAAMTEPYVEEWQEQFEHLQRALYARDGLRWERPKVPRWVYFMRTEPHPSLVNIACRYCGRTFPNGYDGVAGHVKRMHPDKPTLKFTEGVIRWDG